jgi:hypothetical protein
MLKSAVLTSALISSNALLFTNNTEAQQFMFNSFVTEFGKIYKTPEERAHRFRVFVDNLRTIDERNIANGQAVHGMFVINTLFSLYYLILFLLNSTKFADLTQDEFRVGYLGYKKDSSLKSEARVLDEVKFDGSATSVDWSGVYTVRSDRSGATIFHVTNVFLLQTPVKDQGY